MKIKIYYIIGNSQRLFKHSNMGMIIVILLDVEHLPQKSRVGAIDHQAEEQVPPSKPLALVHHQPHPLHEELKVQLLVLVHHLLIDRAVLLWELEGHMAS